MDRKSEEATDDDEVVRGSVVVSSPASTTERVKIPVRMSHEIASSEGGFGLAAAPVDNFIIQMTNCLSGYTASVTELNLDGVEVYVLDRGCLAKLTQFTYQGTVYYPTVADPFTTWQAGDTAIFDEAGAPGTAPLTVEVESTLSDPITGSDVIQYRVSWYNLADGNDRSILWATMGATGTYKIANKAVPDYRIDKVEFIGFSATGAGRFRFTMECNTSIGATNNCTTVPLTSTEYKLVADTYGSAPSKPNCNTIYSTAGTTVLLANRIAPGAGGTVNGGFITATLDGPGPLELNPNMLLVLRSYTSSYQYLNVDITTSAQY